MRIGALAAMLMAVIGASDTGAQRRPIPSGEVDQPAVLTADEVTFDQDLGITTASGNVEIVQGERVLRADTVSYNQRQNTVAASGNVSLLDPTGDVVFADYVELSEGLREGVIQNLRMMMADQSRLAAVSGRRAYGNITTMRKVTYSPCELCKDDPTRAPTWQIKAARVTHDQQEQTITYNDAWIEIHGIPVAYTPYLSHPDGTVYRKSGFLTPEYRSSSVLGPSISVPYYYVIDRSTDVTLEPMFLLKDRPVLGGEYRQSTSRGPLEISASITPAKRRNQQDEEENGTQVRGHFKGKGRFDINDDWRWGFDLQRATDQTYLQRYKLMERYGFLNSTTLTSNVFAENFVGRNYFSANAYAFQGLRPEDEPGLEPIVAPMFDYNYLSDPGAYGGRFSFDGGAFSIYRRDGTRSQRMAGKVGWALPHIASTGEIYRLEATVLGEVYNVQRAGSALDPFRPTDDGVNGRVFPQISLGWSYPWVSRGSTFRTIVSPELSFVAAPLLSDQFRLPNEDSRSVDLDDTSLFRPNRFTGIDRLEGGQRINYGLSMDMMRYTGGRATAFVGQSFRFQRETAFPTGSGLEERQSDYVGRVTVSPHPWLTASHRFQINHDNFTNRRSQSGLSIGPAPFNIAVSYLFVDRSTQPALTTDLEQIATQTTLRIDENWRIVGHTLHSVAEVDRGLLYASASVVYEDECILTGISFTERRVGSRDNPPDTSIAFRIALRNLGEIKSRLF